MFGDADIAVPAALIAEPARARILQTLGDGRALAVSVLAQEAGVATSTASGHLGKLLDGGLVAVEQHGRHRYYRLADEHVSELLELLGTLAPPRQVRSLREGTAARQVRQARTCYDHLAGELGVALMQGLLDKGVLSGGDGEFVAGRDRLSAPGSAVDYRLTEHGFETLESFGIDFAAMPKRRPLIRYCVDWSEQRHHLSGALGAALLDRLVTLDWVRPARRNRAVAVTEAGLAGLAETFGLPALDS
ncbi:MAG: helix-turn-helix transcriptional regulator [Solirubrobacterales bacterium]|nr:helix-turn-helix transcriptional regulator [Solirubrobacterales bacterium]